MHTLRIRGPHMPDPDEVVAEARKLADARARVARLDLKADMWMRPKPERGSPLAPR